MRFYAFNPLAGGILSGKYKFDQAATTGRYAQGTVMGSRYSYIHYLGVVVIFRVPTLYDPREFVYWDTGHPRSFTRR